MLEKLRHDTTAPLLHVIDHVWTNQTDFIRWPKEGLLFAPGVVRQRYHRYSTDQKTQIKAAGLRPDGRSNGPAIMAYGVAGGERPLRGDGKTRWSVHHIYDGRFPCSDGGTATHAVKDGRYFTEAAGLVAIHPVAHALADESPYFAWLLRREAFARFGFDPDGVFGAVDAGFVS